MSDEYSNQINSRLSKAINDLLDEVCGSETEKKKPGRKSNAEKEAEANNSGKITYTLDDKLKVFDRALKLEQLRLKVTEGDEGAAFD